MKVRQQNEKTLSLPLLSETPRKVFYSSDILHANMNAPDDFAQKVLVESEVQI